MVVDHDFDVFHDLGVSLVSDLSHGFHVWGLGVEDIGGLGVEDEWDGEEAFDPFCNVELESVGSNNITQ